MSASSPLGPRRLQRKRTKGWRMPEGAVYIGRGSHLGNPFRIYEHCTGPDGDWGILDTGRLSTPMGHGWTREGAARAAVQSYQQIFDEAHPEGSSTRIAVLLDLNGKDLACWCGEDAPCHGDFLLEVSNTDEMNDFAARYAEAVRNSR